MVAEINLGLDFMYEHNIVTDFKVRQLKINNKQIEIPTNTNKLEFPDHTRRNEFN